MACTSSRTEPAEMLTGTAAKGGGNGPATFLEFCVRATNRNLTGVTLFGDYIR